MWVFLNNLLQSGGISAVLIAAFAFAFVATIRILWSQHERMVAKLADQVDKLGAQLAEVQEKRRKESVEIVERVFDHVNRLDRSLDRIATSTDTLLEVLRK